MDKYIILRITACSAVKLVMMGFTWSLSAIPPNQANLHGKAASTESFQPQDTFNPGETPNATIPAAPNDIPAEEIIRKMEENMRGSSSIAEMTMTVERPRFTRELSFRTWALGEDYAMIFVTAPARDQGTVFLKRYSEIWNYVPSIDRTVKMPPSMMSQSWMGSDFSNDDLVRETSLTDDFHQKILRTERYNDRDAWVIELRPREGAAVVWGKVLIWVSKDGFLQLRVENFDQRDRLANTIELSDFREMGGRTVPARMEMTPADKAGHRTIMQYRSIQFDTDLSPDFFTQQNMRRVR